MALLFLPLPLFLILSLLGPFLPPPARKPVGTLFWISFIGFCGFLVLMGAGLIIATIAMHSYDQSPPRIPVCLFVGVPVGILAVLTALTANVLWGLGQARKLPADMAEEDRREALKRLSRRLWFPLAAAWVLLLLLPWLGLASARYAPQPGPPPTPAVQPGNAPPS